MAQRIEVKPQRRHARIAAALSIIPGLGQLYNRQWVKGIFYLLVAGLYLNGFANLFNLNYS